MPSINIPVSVASPATDADPVDAVFLASPVIFYIIVHRVTRTRVDDIIDPSSSSLILLLADCWVASWALICSAALSETVRGRCHAFLSSLGVNKKVVKLKNMGDVSIAALMGGASIAAHVGGTLLGSGKKIDKVLEESRKSFKVLPIAALDECSHLSQHPRALSSRSAG